MCLMSGLEGKRKKERERERERMNKIKAKMIDNINILLTHLHNVLVSAQLHKLFLHFIQSHCCKD
jgi:hypothetical protein